MYDLLSSNSGNKFWSLFFLFLFLGFLFLFGEKLAYLAYGNLLKLCLNHWWTTLPDLNLE